MFHKLDDDVAENSPRLAETAAESFRLRRALETQKSLSSQFEFCSSDSQIYFHRIQHAAISIYLSGIFDYHEHVWSKQGIPVPKLQPDEIDSHVQTILALTERALSISELSGIVFAFPLRVAGARSKIPTQQEAVTKLLKRVERCYIVAGAFQIDLAERWTLG